MRLERFNKLAIDIKKEFPKFEIAFKNESKLMKLLGFLMFFNKFFMKSYVTTMFGKVYFPTRTWLENSDDKRAHRILRHELVHLRDAKRFPVFFSVSYILLLPTIFTFRALWEWRGYCETIRVHCEDYGNCSDIIIDSIVDKFVGPQYFYMFPFRKFLTKRFIRFRDKLIAAT